jgi:hypothetical protein
MTTSQGIAITIFAKGAMSNGIQLATALSISVVVFFPPQAMLIIIVESRIIFSDGVNGLAR